MFSNKLQVNKLTAQEIILKHTPILDNSTRNTPSPKTRPFSLPDLPISIQINSIKAGHVILGKALLGKEAIVTLAGSASLKNGKKQADLSIHHINKGKNTLTLTKQFDNKTRMLALDLTLSEGPGEIAAQLLNLPGTPPVRLGITGKGPLHNFTTNIKLATNGQKQLSKTITLHSKSKTAQAFATTLKNDLRPILPPDLHPFFSPSSSLMAKGVRPTEGGFHLSDLHINTQAAQVAGTLTIEPKKLPTFFRLTANLDNNTKTPIVLPFSKKQRPTISNTSLHLGFNTSQGPDWTLDGTVETIMTPSMQIKQLTLNRSDQITGTNSTSDQHGFSSTVHFMANNITPDNPGLTKTIRPTLSNTLQAI